MLNLVLLYILCQLLVQGMFYVGLRQYINMPILKYLSNVGISKGKAKTIYLLLGQIENLIITAIVVLVTARASMVGTANLVASAILAIIFAIEGNVTLLFYKENKLKKSNNFVIVIEQENTYAKRSN